GRGQGGGGVVEGGGEDRLRLVAVGGDVDAGRGLVAHPLRAALASVRGERLRVVGLARLLGSHRDDDRRRSHKAAGVGGEEAVLAVFHDEPSMLLPFALNLLYLSTSSLWWQAVADIIGVKSSNTLRNNSRCTWRHSEGARESTTPPSATCSARCAQAGASLQTSTAAPEAWHR